MNIPLYFFQMRRQNKETWPKQSILHICIQMKRNVGNVSRDRVEDFFYKRRPRRPPFLRVESEGIGVTSSIRPIFIPARAKARRADWAPGPGVLVLLPPVARSLM